MVSIDKTPLDLPYELSAFTGFNLKVDSRALRENPLGDTNLRHNYVLVPKTTKGPSPLIFHLSGYFSTGYQVFNSKTLQDNFVEKLDQGSKQGLYPKAVHVFVEASTYWGGSQFINSPGCGKYQDYILQELYPAVCENFNVTSKPNRQVVMGGSSGGYGALSLASVKDSPFGVALAVAPDSFFAASLLPEIFQAAPSLAQYKSFKAIQKKISQGDLQGKKSFFNLMNVVAMAHCYAPASAFKKAYMDFPVDLYSGEVNKKLWREWLKHDPIHFLEKRAKHLKRKSVYLDVGLYDNFSLQFGTRQIAQVLKKNKIKSKLTEFPGNHFGLSERRLFFLETLRSQWS